MRDNVSVCVHMGRVHVDEWLHVCLSQCLQACMYIYVDACVCVCVLCVCVLGAYVCLCVRLRGVLRGWSCVSPLQPCGPSPAGACCR